MSSMQGSGPDTSEPRCREIDAPPGSGARSAAKAGFLGSSRQTCVNIEGASGNRVEHIAGSIRQPATEGAAHRVRGAASNTEPRQTRSGPAADDLNSTSPFGRLGGDAVAPRYTRHELPFTSAEIGARHKVDRAKTATVPVRPARTPLRRAETFFNWIAAAVGACFLLALGIVVYGTLRSPVHLASPVAGVSSDADASTGRDALPQRRMTGPDESMPGRPFAQPAQQPAAVRLEATQPFSLKEPTGRAALADHDAIVSEPGKPAFVGATMRSGASGVAVGKVTDTAGACGPGGMALGLCPSQSEQASPAGSVTDRAQSPKKDDAGQCSKAVFALGLCVQDNN